ncbi:MAG TPA: OmpA family protein [Myxococcus sp.]|nr:OmpA family protein [Myxococcus sp.]
MNLSQRRSDNVRSFLIREGIAGERLEAVGYGETKPVDTNKTAAGRENNRRVEFNILKMAGEAAGKTP